ncbi:MAG: hypothetical protein IPK82_28390 [Polyangiaceae bacterium]|nr:hypothetical protein [Polyangiaceae bacterium]
MFKRASMMAGCLWASTLFGCSATGDVTSGSGATAGSSTTGNSGQGGDTLFDPTGGKGGAGGAAECKNVDILFVVDNSASMGDNQQSLINSFPGFVSAIQEKLSGAESYHIGVVTTDDYTYNDAGCTKIGNLVTKTGGIESSNSTCGPFGGGRRYLDETDSNLGDKFACIAKVGVAGNDDERVARALLNAIDPANNGSGTCNQGFARLDSLLLVVIITDEDDVPDGCESLDPPTNCLTYGSGGTPQEWYDQVIAIKGGLPENVVVLSLLGLSGDNSCGAQVAAKLIGFTNRFGENGYKGDICSTSYDEFFAQTLPIIDKACQEYVEPK